MGASHWRACTLGDLLEIKHGFAFKGEFFSDVGPFVVLTPGNFRENGGLKLKGDKEKFYAGAYPPEYLLKQGDLLVAMTDLTQHAPILGSPAVIPADGLFLHNQRLGKVVNVVQHELAYEFLFYLMNANSVRAQIKGSATGSTVRHTSPSRIYNVAVQLPPLAEQRRIASILSAYDELIENNQRRIKILESMTRAIYREWFVDFRFPGHESVPFVASGHGAIPKGWEASTLGNLVALRKGRSITKDIVRAGNIPVVAGGTSPAYFHDTSNTNGPVITVSASGANAGFVNLYFMDVWASDCTFVDSKTTPHVLYYYLWLDHHRAAITNLQRGSAQPHVYPKDLAMLEALDVPETQLVAFRLQVEPLFNLMSRLTNTVENLRRTRDLLLPRLISGELDVAEFAA